MSQKFDIAEVVHVLDYEGNVVALGVVEEVIPLTGYRVVMSPDNKRCVLPESLIRELRVIE